MDGRVSSLSWESDTFSQENPVGQSRVPCCSESKIIQSMLYFCLRQGIGLHGHHFTGIPLLPSTLDDDSSRDEELPNLGNYKELV